MLSRLLPFLAFFIPILSWGSHNRGGEITYLHLGGLTYEFTITTCTDLGSATGADRPELYLDFDLGTPYAQRDTILRVSQQPLSINHQKNIYIGIHTFTSSGTHRISMEDPNRNAGVLNIWPGGNSDDIVFALESFLIISPVLGALGGNNSVQFSECPCPALGCVNKPYCYNPMSYDPDGDSLSYELVIPLGSGGVPLILGNFYVFPDAIGGGNLTIDPVYGTICWNNPMVVGEFNFTIKISEWRNGYLVGSVLRDVQLTIKNNCTNNPPDIVPINDTCVEAGNTINVTIQGTDQDLDFITLMLSGLPLNLNSSPATFSSVATSGIANGIFQWSTTCNHIQNSSYPILIELEDNGQPVLSDYESFNIRVRPPKVTGLSVQAIGNSIFLKWDKAFCSNAIGYKIYKKSNTFSPSENCCDSPDLSGYGLTLVHQANSINDTSYVDSEGLVIGTPYCYIVTALYDFGQLESCPSDTSCTTLKKEVPLITNVSVINSDITFGKDSIYWLAPTELDTNQFLGPYHYKILNANGNLVHQFPYKNEISQLENNFITNNTNTIDTNRAYKIGLYYTYFNSDSLIGYSNTASSIHLLTVPNDNQIELFWSADVPWVNDQFFIYRADSLNGDFLLIDSSTNFYFLDSGLINQKNYCYYVKSYGSYQDSTVFSPLINCSQKVCDSPYDFTPPCPPQIEILGDCNEEINTLFWTNPNDSCSDDAVSYSLYFTPFLDSSFSLISNFNDINDTTFQHQYQYNNTNSIAGCYYITATDSAIYNNESFPSDTVCFDNCPSYIFPNIFTPNQDNNNDFFQVIMPIKFINTINLNIYNRWGQIVFSSFNPEFKWDGIQQETLLECPSGTYYYQCQINTIRIFGIETLNVNGYFQLTRDINTNNQ